MTGSHELTITSTEGHDLTRTQQRRHPVSVFCLTGAPYRTERTYGRLLPCAASLDFDSPTAARASSGSMSPSLSRSRCSN